MEIRLESIPPEIYKYYWGEPGRFEDHLGISKVKSERYESYIPHIQFSTPEALGFKHLGKRKAHGNIKATELPFWGKASEIRKLYG